VSADPTRPLPEWQRPRGPAEPPTVMRRQLRPRRRRGPFVALIVLLVIIVLLVVSDRVANAYTENQMASQVRSSLALSGKPTVTIHGFPFWTQLAARNFKTVTITGTNETINNVNAGGGALEIASLNATLDGMHIHGRNSATVDQFNATALITFTALGNAGGIPQGITLTPDGGNQVKATISLGPLSDSAVVQVTKSGGNQINVKVVDAGILPVSALGNLADFNVTIPKLPAGVTIHSVSVTQQGLQVALSGHDTVLSQSS
jgi:LmeA-like phospholipid-binding